MNQSSPTTPQGAGAEHTLHRVNENCFEVRKDGEALVSILPADCADDFTSAAQAFIPFAVTACNQHAALTARNKELLQIAVLLCSPHLDEAGLREVLIPMAKKAVASVRGECKNESVCREMSGCVYGCLLTQPTP
jgi:hypothetical protein